MKKTSSVFLFSACLLTLFSACNQEQPEGTISVENAFPATDSEAMFDVYSGDSIFLILSPEKGFEKTYGIEWTLSPEHCGEIIYSKQPERSNRNFTDDRKALFIPRSEGQCTIVASGFWKQTNPQPIDTVTFSIKHISSDSQSE